jgi:hypothetical protein
MASAMRQPWAKPNWVRTADPHGHGVEQKGALPGESDHASVRVQLQKFLVMQILGAHWTPPSH